MKNHIQHLNIQHFKSIKSLDIDCNRINLFIGKPNVGKSNLLEAIALYGNEFSDDDNKYLSDLVRYNEVSNLFYDQNISVEVNLNSELGQLIIQHNYKTDNYELIASNDEHFWLRYDKKLEDASQILTDYFLSESDNLYVTFNVLELLGTHMASSQEMRNFVSPVRKYTFTKEKVKSKKRYNFLTPPYGDNLFQILQTHPQLRKEIAIFFKEYGLELVLDIRKNNLEIQKKVDDLVYKIPYNLTADTLQRIIFHYAAIESNKEAILLLEEPESHSFPPYIKLLAQKIVEANNNQFFIATHSPYLFNTILEEAKPEDIGVFIVTFEDYETRLTKLTSNDISQMLDYGVDVFFNLNWFVNG